MLLLLLLLCRLCRLQCRRRLRGGLTGLSLHGEPLLLCCCRLLCQLVRLCLCFYLGLHLGQHGAGAVRGLQLAITPGERGSCEPGGGMLLAVSEQSGRKAAREPKSTGGAGYGLLFALQQDHT